MRKRWRRTETAQFARPLSRPQSFSRWICPQFTVGNHGHSRFWAVHDPAGELDCVCVYKHGAAEVTRRLSLIATSGVANLRKTPPESSREPGRGLPDAARTVE